MKTSILSLVIAFLVAVLSIFQFERYQKFIISTDNSISELNTQMQSQLKAYNLKLEDVQKHAMATPPLPTNAPPIANNSTANIDAVSFSLMEVENMLQMAMERLQMAQDVQTASQLLKTAEGRLQALNDPQLVPVRESLAQDRVALNAVIIPDLNGLWTTIGALLNQVDTIPVKGLREMDSLPQTLPLSTASTSASTSNSHTSWKDALLQSWQSLKELVKIQRHTKPIEPILSLNEQVLAKEHLRLFLEQMRWAILHTNETVYQDALKNAENWLDTYFETTDGRTQKLEAALKALERIDVHPALPDISHTLQLLQANRR